MTTDSSTQELLAPLGRVASGIYIVTARDPDSDKATGMLCSWVMQAGFEPPTVSVAVKHGRYMLDWLAAGAPLAINIVSENGKSLLSHFGSGFEPGEDAFQGLETRDGPQRVPLLVEDIVGHLVCQPKEHVDSGDHRILLAEVIQGEIQNNAAPMVHVRNSGKHY